VRILMRHNVNGNLHVTGVISSDFSKSAKQPTTNYGDRLLYANESPEILYSDRYTGQLQDGEAIIQIDPIFLECIEPDTEKTPWSFRTECYGENDVYVYEWGADYIKLRERNGGTSNNKFVCWLDAIRNNYAGIRLMEAVDQAQAERLQEADWEAEGRV